MRSATIRAAMGVLSSIIMVRITIKLMKTQSVVRVPQINLRQIWKGKIAPAIAQKADFTDYYDVERVRNPITS